MKRLFIAIFTICLLVGCSDPGSTKTIKKRYKSIKVYECKKNVCIYNSNGNLIIIKK